MAWSFGDGFDLYTGQSDPYQGYWDSSPSGTVNTPWPPGRFAGSRALNCSSGSANPALLKASGANDAVHHIVLAIQHVGALSGTTVDTFVQLRDGATAQCSIVFRSDGAILLTSGTHTGTTLATYTGAITAASTWYAFEFEIVINNTTGRFRVRKNGNTSDDFDSGATLNTRGGTANNYVNALGIGQASTTLSQYVDDLLWRSDASSVSFAGDIRCYTRMPASDASVQFSRTPTGVLTQTVPTSAVGGINSDNGRARYTAFAAAYGGTVTSVSIAVTTVGNAVNMKCTIYADNGANAPGAILASATAPATPVVVGSNVFTFSPGVTIVKGTQYWIGATTDSTNATFMWTASSTNAATGVFSTTAYATFPQASPVVTTPQQVVQMMWTYTATPANWQAVSEPQQDATTSYVYDSNPGDADFYNIGSITSTPASTIAVTTRGYLQKSDAGSRTAAVQIKSGATTVATPTLTLTTSGWQWAWRTDITDPATGGAWTAAAVNNAQIGPSVVS
jgi:hypothetical protein